MVPKAPATTSSEGGGRAAPTIIVIVLGITAGLLLAAAVSSPRLALTSGTVKRSPGATAGRSHNMSGGQAARLESQQQQQQEHQQSLQQLQQLHELISGHVQKLETLSSDMKKEQQQIVQQVQEHLEQQVQRLESVAEQVKQHEKQLEEGLQQLGTASSTQQGTPTVQVNQGPTEGVVCTVLKNEAAYVPEFVAFHLLMGATKIVLYDDNSTDRLKEAAAPAGDAVDIVRMVQGVDGVPGDWGSHRVAGRQGWAYDHCKKHYANGSFTGWFGIWDVDEFVYPCRRPAQKLEGNILWDAWMKSTKAGAHGHQMRCTLFGVNYEDKPQPPGQLVLTNNIRRAPDPITEGIAAGKSWEAVKAGCDKCGCCQVHGTKTIYNISAVRKLDFGPHHPHTKEAVLDYSWEKPFNGLCCNHYQFKSTNESLAKSSANLNTHYDNVAKTEDAKKHLTMLPDHLIWQYLPDMMQLLQAKGLMYEIPPVKQLINDKGQASRKR